MLPPTIGSIGGQHVIGRGVLPFNWAEAKESASRGSQSFDIDVSGQYIPSGKGLPMPNEENAETFRTRAAKWQAEGDDLPPGSEKDACYVIAAGYARLAQYFDRDELSRQPTG
jgi:hypothetical protein